MSVLGNTSQTKAIRIVESVLKGLGLDPEKNRISSSAGETTWQLSRGSADVMIAINAAPAGGAPRLRFVAPIVKVAEVAPALAVELLRLNATALPGLAFGLFRDDLVALVAERSTEGLDRAEVEELLAAIGHYADKYDDLLVNRFGGRRVCDLG